MRRFQKSDVAEPTVPDAVEILKGLKAVFEDFQRSLHPAAIKAAVELSANIFRPQAARQGDRRIDETGASQMLLPHSKRKKTIGLREVETTVATMARIPPKTFPRAIATCCAI